MGLFDRLFKKKLAGLPEPQQPEIASQESTTSSRNKFAEKLKANVNITENVIPDDGNSEVKEENNIKIYNLKNYAYSFDIYKWYINPEERNEYYSSHNIMQGDENLKYHGAVEIHNNEDGSKGIMLKCIGDDKKEFRVEMGKLTEGIHRDVIRVMDQIIGIQLGEIYKDDLLRNEVERLYNELINTKGLELTEVGKKILLNSAREDIQIKENELVEDINKRKEEETLRDLDKKIDKVYDFCKLAIDIGIFGEKDWQAIDKTHEKGNFNESLEEAPRKKYNRSANWRRESYDKIMQDYMTVEDLKELRLSSSKEFIDGRKEGLGSNTDAEELSIRAYTYNQMLSMPLKYESEIFAYQIINSDDENSRDKRAILDDMVAYAKMKYLEERGIVLSKAKDKNKDKDKEDEQIA